MVEKADAMAFVYPSIEMSMQVQSMPKQTKRYHSGAQIRMRISPQSVQHLSESQHIKLGIINEHDFRLTWHQ